MPVPPPYKTLVELLGLVFLVFASFLLAVALVISMGLVSSLSLFPWLVGGNLCLALVLTVAWLEKP